MKLNHLFSVLLIFFISCSSSGDDSVNPQNNMEEEIEEIGSELTGKFVSDAHPTSGMVVINPKKTELNFTNFKSDNGPLLELYIATDIHATDYVSLGVIGELGKMDLIEGDATFLLPQNIDFTTHKYVLIWCSRFSVNFGYAVLE